MKKSLLVFIIATMASLQLLASTKTINGIKWTYEIKSGAVTIKGCTPCQGKLTIPSKIDGRQVTGIGAEAFKNCGKLTAVVIPSGVTSLGDYAFSSCFNITSITLPSGLKSIGNFAFNECRSMKTLNLPSSVRSIGIYAFCDCSELTSMTIPSGVKTISDGLFFYCNKLVSVSIPSSVTKIKDYAFGYCNSLKSVNIPPRVTSIGEEAFSWCAITSVNIPPSVKTIGPRAFQDCYFPSINIPEGVESIGDCVFQQSGSFQEITSLSVPSSLTSWGYGAFDTGVGSHHPAIYYAKGDDLDRVKGFLTHNGIDDVDTLTYNEYEWYNVKFVANGGSGTMGVQKIRMDKNSTLLPNKFTRAGFVFSGWSTTSSGGVKYTDCKSVENLSSAHGKEVKLYAVWKSTKPGPYKVAFNANGGAGTMSTKKYAYSKYYTLPANVFTRKGYHFAGWAKTKSGDVKYKNKQSVKNLATGGTVTLYAVWTANKYKVAFVANGGTGTMASKSYRYGKSYALPANAFKRKGYTFAGWAKSAKGDVKYANGGAVKSLTSKNGATVKLYAKWKPVNYSIWFYSNDDADMVSARTYTYGKSYELHANPLYPYTRDGYHIVGWAKSPTGEIVYKSKATIKNLTAKKDGVVELYAVWKPNTYKVVFVADGGKGTMETQSFTYGKYQKLLKNKFTRTGCKFSGWVNPENGEVYGDEAKVRNLTTKNGATVTLKATWLVPPPSGNSVSGVAKTVAEYLGCVPSFAVRYAECDSDVDEALAEAGEDAMIEYIVLLPGEYEVYDPELWEDETLDVSVGNRVITLVPAP